MSGIIFGFVLLVLGTEAMLRGGLAVLRRLGVPAWVGAATLVAYGAAMPELLIAVESARSLYPDIALGNILGSTLFNLLPVTGLAACLLPLQDNSRETRLLAAALIAASVLLFLFLQDGMLERLEAGVLLLGILAVTVRSLWRGREETRAQPATVPQTNPSFLLTLCYLLVAGIMLPWGTVLLLQSTLQLAQSTGLPAGSIAVSVLAFGSALPELTMVLLAARHGVQGSIIRNLLASSLFNITAILGVAGLVAPLNVSSSALQQDTPALLVAAFLCSGLLLFNKKIPKAAGALLLGLYLCYIVWRLS